MKLNKEIIIKAILTFYVLASIGYLYFIDNRGIVDFVYLLFPLLIWFLTKKLSFKNRAIISLTIIVVMIFSLNSSLNDNIRFWCYEGYEPFFSESIPFESQQDIFEINFEQYCLLHLQLLLAGINLIIISIVSGIISGIIMLIWKKKI